MKIVCPWWLGYFLLNPLRRLMHNPARLLSPYVKEGMRVLDIGPGMGFFSLPLARMVGESGRVICVDLQEKMLQALLKRAAKAGVSNRIETRLCVKSSLCISDLAEKIDFVLVFAVLHELPDPKNTFLEIGRAMKPNAPLLIAEPKGHVSKGAFKKTLSLASGFKVTAHPHIRGCLSALLYKAR
jgi:ubiquinone/menaquinone biosynthesis C-methylase UbiE